MYSKVVSVLSNSGTGTQDITFTADPAWTPKVAIVQWNRANTSADTFQEHMGYGKGFTDGTNQRCISVVSEDNQARGDASRLASDTSLITALGTSQAVDAVATFTQWLSNGMQITWSDAPAAQFYIHVLFLGGDDITNATVGTLESTATTGDKSITSLTYQPDFGYFLFNNTPVASEDTVQASAYISEGAATSSSAQWCQAIYTSDNPVTMSTRQGYSHTKLIINAPTFEYATFSSFNSNGFTINVGSAFAANSLIYYLVMKGGSYTVGNDTEPASTQQQTITTSKDVKAVMVFGLDTATADGAQGGHMWTSGMGTASGNQGCNVHEDTNNIADSIVVSRHDTNQIYLNITSNATAGSSTLDDEAALYSVSSTNFVLDWTNIGQARPFRYVTFGDSGLTSVTKTLTTRYDITSLVTKQLTTRYDITSLVTKQLTVRYNIVEATPVMTQVVRFQKDSSGTTDATQDINLNFTPKAIMVFSDGNTADNSVSAHYQWIQGFSDGTNHACISNVAEDAVVSSSDTYKSHRNDSVFIRLTESTGAVASRATCAFSTDKVTLTWAVNDTAATYLTMVAYGGASITNAKVNTVTVTKSGTGTQDYTGLGFTPAAGSSVLCTLMAGATASGESSIALGSMGAATSTSARWALGQCSEDAVTPTDTWRIHRTDACLYQFTTAGATDGYADFSAWINDGFRLNVTDAFSDTSFLFSYLVIKGGTWDTGILTSPATATNNVDHAVSVSSQPIRGFMMAGNGNEVGTLNTIITTNLISVGATDGTNQSAIGLVDEDNVGTSDSYRISNSSGVARVIANDALAANTASFDSFGTNNVRLDWSVALNAEKYGYIVVADGEALASIEKSLTTRYDIAQEITKQLTTRYDITSLVTKQLTLRYDVGTFVAQVQVVRFQKDNSGTADATQDVNLNFTPKAIILFSDGSTADNSVSAHYQWIQGFSDGTNHCAWTSVSEDGQTASDSASSHYNDAVFVRLLESFTTITVQSKATCSFGTNKVTLTWPVNDTDATYITMVAYGGNGITNAKVGTVQAGRTTVGSQDYTGLGFTPTAGNSALITMGSNATGNGELAIAFRSFGAAVSSTNRWVTAAMSEDAADPTDTWRVHRNDACLFIWQSTGAVAAYADFNSWIDDGFRLDWDDPPGATTYLFSYLVINGTGGVTWDCGSLTSPTSAQSQNTSVSVSSLPIKGLLMAGTGITTANTITTVNAITVGASDGNNESVIGAIDEDNQTDSDSYRVNEAGDNVVRLLAADGANQNVAEFTSFGTNQFTLNWTTASAAQYYGWLVVASESEELAEITKQLTLRYNLEQEITKQLTLRYNIEQAITKSLTLRYDVTALAEKTLTLLYNLEQEITKQLTTRYDITALVEKALTIIHNIEQEIEKSLTTRYNIEQQIEKSLTTRYNVEQEIIKQLILRYDIEIEGLTEVVKSLTLLYNVEQEIEKSLTLRYDVTEKVPDKSLTLRYDITQLIEKTLTLRHNIEQEIEKALTLLYNIEEQAIKTLTTRYNIEQAIEKVNTIRYDITALLEKPLTLRYNITSLVDKTLTTRYDITQQVPTVPVTIRYNITQEIEKTNTLLYNIEQEIEKGLTIRYDIEGALEQIIKTLTLRYNIDAQAIKTLTTRYNIENTILKSLTMRYDITQLVPEKSLTLRWDILQQIIKTATLIYQIEASLAVLITDRGYKEPLRARIQFVARGTPATVYYSYDSFDPDNRPFNVIALDIRLAQGEIGTFSLSIEDSADIVDKSKIGLGVKVIIDVKKEATGDWQRMITGFVRRIRPERPATGALIYEITGYGSQVIFNERIVNFKRAAKRTAIDSSIPLSTDKKMEAHNLFRDLVSATDILPIRKPAIQDTGNFTSLDGISSDVIDFISQIAPGLTDASSVANAIAEITGAIWGTDEYGNPFFRYPTQKHSGIIIKDVPESTDSALDTSINLAPFEFDDSIDTTEGFANRLYVLNAVSTKSTASSSGATGSTTLTTRGIAQQFTATDNNITGAAFILSKIGEPTTKDNVVFGYLRADNNGYPTGATLASFQITFDQIETAKSTIFVNDIKPADGTIIPGNKYWWFLFSALTDDSNTVRWHHDNDLITANRLSATLPLIDQDPSKPGNQLLWTRSVFGPVYSFSTFSSIRHILEHSDPESIKQYGLIEQIVDLPAFEDDITFQKALSKIIAYSAKPKRIYQYNLVTIPTGHLFMPGQLVTVVDSKAKLTSEKNVIAEIAEVTYNWDTSSNAIGCKHADVHLIGFLDTKLDDYLDEKVC